MDETLLILIEECSEVIQAVSKCQRFGLDGCSPGVAKTNRQRLEEELGDLVCMIDILVRQDIVSNRSIDLAKLAKFEKLKSWSRINPIVLNK